MNRRNFISTLVGASIAGPVVAQTASKIEAVPHVPRYLDYYRFLESLDDLFGDEEKVISKIYTKEHPHVEVIVYSKYLNDTKHTLIFELASDNFHVNMDAACYVYSAPGYKYVLVDPEGGSQALIEYINKTIA